MELIETLVVVVHVIVAAGLVGLVLLQQGKGADIGASFGAGASQTLFGSEGSGSFLTRMTSILALVFFISSFALAVFAKQKADVIAAQDFVPVVEESSPTLDDTTVDDAAPDLEEGTPLDETPELE